jgi:flavorubredoxin/GGDEF domain-containing protein
VLQNPNLWGRKYWIGAEDSYNHLHCNTYLIVDGGEGLLIDPGPVMTFPTVEERVRSIIPIEDLSCIVLLHQDPDVAGATPLFEKAGFSGMIAATRRTSVIAAYYDIASPFYLVEEHEFRVTFRSGKEIEFLPATYIHFPGAIMAYDPTTRFLFSGDLFGAFTEDWNLFADETYIESMAEFHREYMPSNDILRPVMEVLLGRDIAAICPQHGSIIDRDIARHITVLRDLQCGIYIDRVRRSIGENRDTSFLINMVLEKLIAAFGKSEVVQCLTGSRVEIHEETGEAGPIDGPFDEVWNYFFNRIYACGGHRWFAVVEPLIDKFIQIDHMRQLNQTIGEQKGNELIAGIGSLLQSHKREEDYLFRIDGPVFVLVSPPEENWEGTEIRAERLRTITEFHPDAIVSELFLLETDAFSLKEELDMNSKTSGIPFILVSHQKNESTIVRALDLGIVHYIRKPYMLTELLGILNTYVLKAMKHV